MCREKDDPHLKAALRAGQGINLSDLLISPLQVLDGSRGGSQSDTSNTVKSTLSSFSGGLSPGLSVPSFRRCPMDLFEYQPYYAEFKIMLSFPGEALVVGIFHKINSA